MIRSGSTGTEATPLPRLPFAAVVQVPAPQRALRQPEARPAAPRAHLLVMTAAGHVVVEPELALDRREVTDHLERGVRLAAPPAPRLFTARAGVLVEADAELGR